MQFHIQVNYYCLCQCQWLFDHVMYSFYIFKCSNHPCLIISSETGSFESIWIYESSLYCFIILWLKWAFSPSHSRLRNTKQYYFVHRWIWQAQQLKKTKPLSLWQFPIRPASTCIFALWTVPSPIHLRKVFSFT